MAILSAVNAYHGAEVQERRRVRCGIVIELY
jgi:hypothetical protein